MPRRRSPRPGMPPRPTPTPAPPRTASSSTSSSTFKSTHRVLRNGRGYTPFADAEVANINANPAAHPATPSLPPTPPSTAASSVTQYTPDSFLYNSSKARSAPSTANSMSSSTRSMLTTRQERLDQKRNDYFAARALSAQEKEIRSLEKELKQRERRRQRVETIEKRRKRKKNEALRPDKPFSNKSDKDAVGLIDWLRNYTANKAGGTLDTFVEMFADLDQDSNQMIDFGEFKGRIRAFGGYSRAPTKMLKRAFDVIDTNKDGELSINELRYAIVSNAMGDKIYKFNRKMYNDGILRQRNEKLSHIREIRGQTSMLSPKEQQLISPVAVQSKWIKKNLTRKKDAEAKDVNASIKFLPAIPGCLVVGSTKNGRKGQHGSRVTSTASSSSTVTSRAGGATSAGSSNHSFSRRRYNPISYSATPFGDEAGS